MTEQLFWNIIEESFNETGGQLFKDSEARSESIIRQLDNLSREDLILFNRHFETKVVEADHYNVMALLFIIEGSVTDDPYLYFRCELVGQGRNVFENAIKDTDSLSGILAPDIYLQSEYFMKLADKAYLKKFGEGNLPSGFANDIYGDTQGEDWEYEDLPIRFPKLCAKFNYVP
jgi:hypothetical protein